MRVNLMGCGSVGSQLIAQLINIIDIDELHLYDKDIIEPRNVAHRIRLKQSIGRKKVETLRDYLVGNFDRIKPQSIILHHGDILKLSKDFIPSGLMIDCLDNPEARKFTTQFDAIHVGFNPLPTGLVHWNEGYQIPENNYNQDPCDKQELYVFISFLASVACMSIYDFVTKGIKNNYIVDHNFVKKIL